MASSHLFFLIVSIFVVQSISAAGPLYIKRLTGRNGTVVQPPAPFKCVKSGFFGDLKDCTRFYRCVDFYGTEEHFTLFEFVCGEGTIFDESLSVCNHPSWVSPAPACLSGAVLPSESGGVTGPVDAGVAGPTDTGTTGAPGPVDAGNAGSSAGSVDTAAPTGLPCNQTHATSSTASPSGSSSAAPSVSETPSSTVDSVSESTSSPFESENIPGTSSPSVDSGAGTVSPVDSESNGPIPDGSLTSGSVPPSESSTSLPSGPDSSSSSATESSTSPALEASSVQTDSPSSTQSTDSTTTESTTVSSAPSSEASVTSAPPIAQPPTVPPSFALICGDQKFHRHPLRCDLYYQCVWTELSFSIDLKACPAGSVYDEPSGNCLSPSQSAPCQVATLSPSGSESTTEVALPPTTAAPQYTLAPGSLYNCQKPGHFPYQLDCVRFYRCFEVQPSVLKGLLYRCPPNYGYSTVTERCVKEETLPPCDRTGIRLPSDYPVPLIPLEDTTMVRVEDLESFFSNPNSFYRPSQLRYIFFK